MVLELVIKFFKHTVRLLKNHKELPLFFLILETDSKNHCTYDNFKLFQIGKDEFRTPNVIFFAQIHNQ